jgi:predicted nucleotide-binding protein (sugar kinase/HSP70/actin superfamily)
MSIKIGVSRALYSFYHYPFWHKFFEELNCEVILSPATTRKILDAGVKIAPEEICLPIKAYLGHIAYLKDKADYILVPRIVCLNTQRATLNAKRSLKFGCPKAIGLPDMVKSIFSDLPQIIDLTFDERIIDQQNTFYNIGQKFNKDKIKIQDAFKSAKIEQDRYDSLLLNGLKPSEIFLPTIPENNKTYNSTIPNIGLIGHPYLIYDDLLSLSLFDTIENLGARVQPVNSVCKATMYDEMEKIPKVHWFYEQDIIGSTAYFLRQHLVSGILFAFSFSCGTSSVVTEIIRKELLEFYNIPSLTLLFDEHTSPAGLLTRIESFIDLLTRNHVRLKN